jgi:hypothetical protein
VDAVPRDDARVTGFVGFISVMSPCDKPSFSRQIGFDIKYHVTADLFVTNWNLVVIKKLECNVHILHFFFNGIAPEGSPRVSIDSKGLLHSLWQLDAKFLRALPIFSFDFLDYSISLAQCLSYPPLKRWFFVDLSCDCVLSKLNRVGLLTSFKGRNRDDPSSISTSISQPTVVFFLCPLRYNGSSRFTANLGSTLCPTMSLNTE